MAQNFLNFIRLQVNNIRKYFYQSIIFSFKYIRNFIKSYFYKFSKPILGICRGIQAINVAFGGTLYQDLPSEYGNIRKETHSGNSEDPNPHLVYFEKDTYGETVSLVIASAQ